MNTSTLLIEFLTEELPPINLLKTIGESFTKNILQELKNFIINSETALPQPQIIASPRRFGCLIKNINSNEPNSEVIRKGPAVASGLIDNKPTKALEGFMRSCNITNISELEQNDGYFYARQQIAGKNLDEVLETAINSSLKKLPIAKNMRWGNNDFSFVRPVHNLVLLHGNRTITLKSPILGLTPVNYTLGHRVMSSGRIVIENVDNYFDLLKQHGKVMASYSERKEYIEKQLLERAYALKLGLNNVSGLLDEVTALVEYPVVLDGHFASDFLQLPKECLVLSMAKNQKYFALINGENLSNKFLFIANIESAEPSVVINGNERVLSARLADAKFFFDVDKKHPLEFYSKKLEHVVYHNQLGSQSQRIERLKYIAGNFAEIFGVEVEQAKYTASIMKADLATEMVGEFPELQGVMGKYYALHHGEPDVIANAIEKHYYPRFSGDEIPNDNLSVVVSLADKLETLIGIWGIGLIPTGDKDPFALRRMALGVVRILLKNQINLKSLITIAFDSFRQCNNINLEDKAHDEVYQFIIDRLSNYLTDSQEFHYSTNCIKSVCSKNPQQFSYIPTLLDRLEQFANNPSNQLIISANKRIENIFKKSKETNPENHWGVVLNPEHVNIELFQHQAERDLFDKIEQRYNSPIHNQNVNSMNWEEYFKGLEEFNPLVGAFFDNVMVMDENMNIRNNRIKLLRLLHYGIMNQYCTLSELSNTLRL